MRKFLPLLLCFLLSIFTVARATNPARTPLDTKTTEKEPIGQGANTKALLKNANTDEDVTSDDDEEGMEVPSNDDGEDMNNDDGGDAAGDEGTGDDDGGGDDGGGDEGGGDEGE
jgi:hypothetical protein